VTTKNSTTLDISQQSHILQVRPFLNPRVHISKGGLEMEALSPRDANAPIRNKQPAQKLKAPASKPTQKEKDHPPPPPDEVQEPPSSDRKDGAIYQTGRLLGRGGFAICYEARLSGTKQTYALKIVKSHMPQKKMEQKVRFIIPRSLTEIDYYKVSNRAPNPFKNEPSQYRSIPQSICLR
jgi:hypothetical protein